MPTGRFAEFIRFHCTCTERACCATCGRDFIVPTSAIEGVYRTEDDKADIVLTAPHYRNEVHCDTTGEPHNFRYLKTSIPWGDVTALLNGSVLDAGDAQMKFA